VVIPPNIAPLNFVVEEPAAAYYVKVRSTHGDGFAVASRSSSIRMPLRRWRRLLEANRGEQLFFDVYAKAKDGGWARFDPISSHIAREPIDSHLVYRFFRSVYTRHGDMAIMQRNLESFDERTLLDNRQFGRGCVNCHSFLKHNPDDMVVHTRTPYGFSTIVSRGGKLSNVKSDTPFGGAPMGGSSWHPSGRLIVFSVYRVRQFFHTARREMRDAIELDSGFGYYLFGPRKITSAAPLARYDNLEMHPEWTPNGRYLYFCNSPVLWSNRHDLPTEYPNVRYSLLRVPYDIDTDRWGKIETVLDGRALDKSITQPRFSPDGRYLLFCMADYGCFPAFRKEADIYIVDVSQQPLTPRRLACNSDEPESWHCWSSNGRWIAFSSKRRDGILNRAYFAYFDKDGRSHKAFLLPQRDPTFYDSCIKIYQLPELVTGPVRFSSGQLAQLLRSPGKITPDKSYDGVTAATPPKSKPKGEPWRPVAKPDLGGHGS